MYVFNRLFYERLQPHWAQCKRNFKGRQCESELTWSLQFTCLHFHFTFISAQANVTDNYAFIDLSTYTSIQA